MWRARESPLAAPPRRFLPASYVVRHEDVEYVVLRRERRIVAVVEMGDDDDRVLTEWPKEIESR